MLEAAHLGFKNDTEIMLGSGVGSLRKGTKCLEFSIPVAVPDNLCNEAWKLSDRHMLGETMVVDPVGAISCIFNDPWIF